MEPDAARGKVEEILAAQEARSRENGVSLLREEQRSALAEICGVDG